MVKLDIKEETIVDGGKIPLPLDLARHQEVSKLPEKGHARWRELITIYTAVAADALAMYVMAPFTYLWLKDDMHIPDADFKAGLLLGSLGFAGAFAAPFFGWW